ncbi:MAG: YhjD/YihY/BrkB family envelope integrity protein [Verrucomicrobiota bacterium]
MSEKISWLKRLETILDERGLRSEADLTRLTKFVHFWILLGRSFVRNRCPIRASALSYTTLLAMIPMLAVALSVSTSLLREKGETDIYRFVDKFVSAVIPPANISGQTNSLPASDAVLDGAATTNLPVVADAALSDTNTIAGLAGAGSTQAPAAGNDRLSSVQRDAANKIHEFVKNTRSGALGVTGMIVLVVIAIRMLSQVESTFNDIWGVTRGRNWFSRIFIYWTTITLGPLLIIAALGLASGPHFESTQSLIARMPVVGPVMFPVLTLLVLWLTFALVYQLVPNTKVQFSAALIGGIVAGSLWHLNNLFGFLYVSRVVTNNKIYGSLFLLPVFMAGLYLTWFILLLGAQVAYAFQNRTLYLQDKIAENVNQRGREFVALRLMTCIGQRFQRGLPPATIQEMSRELAIPSRLVQQVLHTLIAAHLVTEIHGAEAAYAPARPLENINAHHILQAMRATLGQELVTRDEPIREEVYGEFARIQDAEKQAASSLTMLALVGRAQARLELVQPKADDDLKTKPALVPNIPAAQKSEPMEIATASTATAVLSETRPAPVETISAESAPAAAVPAVETKVASTVLTPDEKDFPL